MRCHKNRKIPKLLRHIFLVGVLCFTVLQNDESLVFAAGQHLSTPQEIKLLSLPPTKREKPVDVAFAIKVLDILEVNTKNFSWDVRAFMFARWKDKRLRFKAKDNNGAKKLTFVGERALEKLNSIWHPSLFIVNQKRPRETESLELVIHRNGIVEIKEMFNATLVADFNFKKFPFDKHIAKIEIEALTHTKKEVRLVPGVRSSGTAVQEAAAWTVKGFNLEISTRPESRFELSSAEPGAWLAPGGANDFSIAVVEIFLHRNSGSFMWVIAVPLLLFMAVLWTNSMTVKNSVRPWPFALLLGIIFFSHGAQTSLPELPYLTLFNIWLVEIYVFIFIDFLLSIVAERQSALGNESMVARVKKAQLWVMAPLAAGTWTLSSLFVLEIIRLSNH
ncbi:MAG: hypothetical protein CBC11_000495 [Proteobacteria bacterium TMED51]|jgi:hypothetical protein|nr:MAG: hypothetical protein CBC11_000495 [Proteobacteria bacterium TMED51]|tara:strand:- start:37 stop:1206 length:1170 start_codon:yes stop_codon:yes gene_type:complete